mmetsp:Transcript_13820/g.39141  ORF Transcript_13820/g.39141 Transcript_13820/m.39141 type:complete len:242 (-) Transcript_13820:27-752(-)
MCQDCASLQLDMQLSGRASGGGGGGSSKDIKRLENAIRELARITLSQERDSVLLGGRGRDQKGEFFKCLSCDNHPISVDELQKNVPDILPIMGASTPQAYMGRDKSLHPHERARAATASPDAKGRMYTSSPMTPGEVSAWPEQVDGTEGGVPRAAIHSNLPTVLSTSNQMTQGLSMRMESFAPYSDLPPPQFHGRGRDIREAAGGSPRSSTEQLPSITGARTANSSPLRGRQEHSAELLGA